MSIFITGLGILSVMCALIYKRSTHPECRDAQFSKFKRTYLFVYLLATGRTKTVFILHSHHAVARYYLVNRGPYTASVILIGLDGILFDVKNLILYHTFSG